MASVHGEDRPGGGSWVDAEALRVKPGKGSEGRSDGAAFVDSGEIIMQNCLAVKAFRWTFMTNHFNHQICIMWLNHFK